MISPKAFPERAANRLLSALSYDERERLTSRSERVHLSQGQVLYEIGDTVRYAYFLTGGVVSLLSVTEDGGTIEVAMVGSEGMIGIPALLGMNDAPYRVMVQIHANAVRIRAEKLVEEFGRGGRFQDLLLRYIHTLITQITQSAVCNRFHTVEERLCRWLLVISDRVSSDEFRLTQEFIAHMLGVPRTSVTMIAGGLRRGALISYRRGKINILDRRGLEAAACECHKTVRSEISKFLAA